MVVREQSCRGRSAKHLYTTKNVLDTVQGHALIKVAAAFRATTKHEPENHALRHLDTALAASMLSQRRPFR